MIQVLFCFVVSQINQIHVIQASHQPDKADFMNIEVGSKYTVGNEMTDYIKNNDGIITLDDLIIGNVDSINDAEKRIEKGLDHNESQIDKTEIGNIDRIYNKMKSKEQDKRKESTNPVLNAVKEKKYLQIESTIPMPEIVQYYDQHSENKILKRLSQPRNVDKGFKHNNQEDIVKTNHKNPPNGSYYSQFENSKTALNNTSDHIKQMKLGFINSLKHYNNKININTTILKLDNFEIKILKRPKVLARLDEIALNINMSDDGLDALLAENLLKTIQSHQIVIGFTDENSKDELLNQLAFNEGRAKKKKNQGYKYVWVAFAMSTAGLLFLKMVSMKALLLSMLSLLISMRKGVGRHIESKYQLEPIPAALTAPVCNCKCPGERNRVTSGAYRLNNEHKNGFITVDPNGEELDVSHDGTDYYPHQMAYKNIYLPPGGDLHATRFEKREDGE